MGRPGPKKGYAPGGRAPVGRSRGPKPGVSTSRRRRVRVDEPIELPPRGKLKRLPKPDDAPKNARCPYLNDRGELCDRQGRLLAPGLRWVPGGPVVLTWTGERT